MALFGASNIAGDAERRAALTVFFLGTSWVFLFALAILTTRRFHVWEGAAALHQPFVDACLLRGLEKLASGDNAEALRDFQLADTYPENLQAGRPGDAGQGPNLYDNALHRAGAVLPGNTRV